MTRKRVYGPHTLEGLQYKMLYGPHFVVHLVLKVLDVLISRSAGTPRKEHVEGASGGARNPHIDTGSPH